MTDRPRLTTLALGRVLLALLLAVCPAVRSSATSPAAVPARLPAAPVEEHEEEHRPRQSPSEAQGEEAAALRGDRRAPNPPSYGFLLPLSELTSVPRRGATLTRAAPADPFRNGLGCPFRC